MPNIISSTSFNPSNFQAPGLYINNIPPVPYLPGVPTNVGFVVGTADWGPVNAPAIASDPANVQNVFGGITAASVTDTHDLCTDMTIAFQQGFISLWGVRVTDGTDTKASTTLMISGGTVSGGTIEALYSGSLGNEIVVTINQASLSGYYNVFVQAPFASQESYPNIPGSTFWTSLSNALSSGIQGVVASSSLVRLVSGATASNALPATGTFTLSGGTSGRNVTSDDLLGQDQTYPPTGFYLTGTLKPHALKAWIAGLTDTSIVPNMVAYVNANAMYTNVAFPMGTSTAQVQSIINATGVADYEISWVKDWIYWNDPVNAMVRMVPPLPFTMGLITALSPAQSPLNKQVQGVVGTERNNPYTGNTPYSQAEIGILQSLGVLVITNPVPQGAVFGVATGTNTSTNTAQSPVEYASMTNYLDDSFSNIMGTFVGRLQTAAPGDPLRASVRHTLNDFLQGLRSAGLVDAYSVTCTYAASGNPQLGVNTPSTIAQHYLYAYAAVRYLSSVWFFVISLQGGTTVVTVSPAQSASATVSA